MPPVDVGESASPARESGSAQGSVCDTASGYPCFKSRKEHMACLRAAAKRLFQFHALTCKQYEDYLRERSLILGTTGGGIAMHEGKGYDMSNPTLRQIERLEALTIRNLDVIRRYWAVKDTLDELARTDPEAKRLVEVCYMEPGIGRGRDGAYIEAHADELGIYLSERQANRKLQKAKEMLAWRMGWLKVGTEMALTGAVKGIS